jgi:selenocysteine-specific elongation factor
VDRTFSVAGAGTVVTGTAWSGSVRAGDSVQLWPGGALARVRGIEVHGEPCDATVPGRRTALALNGVSVRHAARGSVVVRPGDGWSESTALDVELDLSGSRTSLRPGERIWLHLGTAAVLARVGGASELIPRGRMPVRLRLERPLLARGGDRFVVRTYSPVAVIGGGIVLDPQPVPSRVPAEWSSEAASRLSVLVSRRRWGIGMEVWPVLAGPLPPGSTRQHVLAAAQLVEVGGRVLARADREAHSARIRALVSAHHEARPHEPGVGLEALRQQLGAPPRLADALVSEAVRAGHVLVVGDVASLPGFSMPTEATEAQARHLCQVLAQARMAPTPIASLAQVLGFEPYRLLQELERAGEVVRLTSELAILAVSLTEFRRLLEEIGRAGPITPAAIRDRSGLSRKHTIPLLEWADRTGITVRTGDARTLRPAPSGTHSSAPAALPG